MRPFDDASGQAAYDIDPIRFDAGDLDTDANPRDDLDAFVNARWRRTNPVPTDRSCWDAFALLAERALHDQARIAEEAAGSAAEPGSAQRIVADFWTSGTAADDAFGTTLLAAELARIDALDSSSAIAAYIRDRHARGNAIVFSFDVEPDFDDPDRMIAAIRQGPLGLRDRDAYFDTSSAGEAKRCAYLAHIGAMLELSGVPAAHATLRAGDALAFETELAKASTSRRTLARDISSRFRSIDIDEADHASPDFPWSAFFDALGVATPARFSLAMPDFHAKFAELLATTAPENWRSYLRFRTIDDAAPYLGGAFATQHHRFHADSQRGQRNQQPRWKIALDAINRHAGEAMGELYVARHFSAHAKTQIVGIAERLREALADRLEKLVWMSAPTRERALGKLETLALKIGYPDRWRDWSEVKTSATSLYANVLAARQFDLRRRVRQIGRQTDRTQWPVPPQTVNAGYDPQRNEIVFPAAILAPPFFDIDADAALNYGAIGAVIAHEMIHGFDDQGSRFDEAGRFRDWWQYDDRARFDVLAARLADRFDAECTAEGRVDGQLTLGENIADFGGLAVAFDALQVAVAGQRDPMIDGHTQAQRFFFSWATIWRQNLTSEETRLRLAADVHAPARLRANQAPSHLDGYAKAFACREGDAMLAEPRISIW